MKNLSDFNDEQITKLQKLAEALDIAGFFDETPSKSTNSISEIEQLAIEEPFEFCLTPSLLAKEDVKHGVYTKGFEFLKEIAEIYETETYSINISLQTERFSGRTYMVFTKFRDGEAFRKFTIPVGLAHAIAYFMKEIYQEHGNKTPRPVHIDNYL